MRSLTTHLTGGSHLSFYEDYLIREDAWIISKQEQERMISEIISDMESSGLQE